tara:strand:+ start:684 stop:1295 length:612 start_codon:yes stop_codon:yes gene_type:complete
MTHTHKGTCQLCGRIHAVNNKTGEIAKHGYTVDYGFFNGVCQGSNILPLQKDREELDLQVEAWEKIANKQLSTTEAEIESVPVRVRQGGVNKILNMDESAYIVAHRDQYAPTFQQAVQIKLANIHSRANGLLTHAADMKALADKIFGTELFPVASESKKIKEFDSYSVAYQFFLELKEKGIKATIRRPDMYSHVRRVYWKEAA